jgi:hypothetical protein
VTVTIALIRLGLAALMFWGVCLLTRDEWRMDRRDH